MILKDLFVELALYDVITDDVTFFLKLKFGIVLI